MTTTIPLVEADEVRNRRGSKAKGEKYGKYTHAIEPHIQWIKDEIANSKDGTIRVRNADIAQAMGGEFVKKADTSIYWGLKYSLFNAGVVVETATAKNGDKLLLMRLAKEDDQLPESLSKYQDAEGEETETKV